MIKVVFFILLFILSFTLPISAELTMCQCQGEVIEWIEEPCNSYEEALEKFKSLEDEYFHLPSSNTWEVNVIIPTFWVAQIIYIPSYIICDETFCIRGTYQETECSEICVDGQEKWIVLYPQIKCVDCVPIE